MGNQFYPADYEHYPNHQPWVDFSGELLAGQTFSAMWLQRQGVKITAPNGWYQRMARALGLHA